MPRAAVAEGCRVSTSQHPQLQPLLESASGGPLSPVGLGARRGYSWPQCTSLWDPGWAVSKEKLGLEQSKPPPRGGTRRPWQCHRHSLQFSGHPSITGFQLDPTEEVPGPGWRFRGRIHTWVPRCCTGALGAGIYGVCEGPFLNHRQVGQVWGAQGALGLCVDHSCAVARHLNAVNGEGVQG